jgi:dUTP pyrophosphatase
MSVSIQVKTLPNYDGLSLPNYATAQSAGMDLMAAIDAPITLKPQERRAIPTGIAIALPAGYEAQVRPRSGLAIKNGITMINAPGTIDADYRGEVAVLMVNLGTEDFVIERGMRVAQMVIAKYETAQWEQVSELNDTARGTGGFGSTGTQAA